MKTRTASTRALSRWWATLSGMGRCPWTRPQGPSFVTSHFYLDDFVQSSEDPNPRPLQHTPLQAILRTHSCRGHGQGWREGTKGAAEPALLRPEAGVLASNGQGPPLSRTAQLQTARNGRRSRACSAGLHSRVCFLYGVSRLGNLKGAEHQRVSFRSRCGRSSARVFRADRASCSLPPRPERGDWVSFRGPSTGHTVMVWGCFGLQFGNTHWLV